MPGPRLPPRTLRLAILGAIVVVLGVATNILVAWSACAYDALSTREREARTQIHYQPQQDIFVQSRSVPGLTRYGPVPGIPAERWYIFEEHPPENLGRELAWRWPREDVWTIVEGGNAEVGLEVITAGLPRRALTARTGDYGRSRLGVTGGFAFEITEPTWQQVHGDLLVLPYEPHWSGFVVNTVFYAGAWGLVVFAAVRVLRRRPEEGITAETQRPQREG